MKISDGMKSFIMRQNWSSTSYNDFLFYFIEGTMPTRAELEQQGLLPEGQSTGNLTYVYMASPRSFVQRFLPARGEKRLAHIHAKNIKPNRGSNGSYTLDMTSHTEGTNFIEEGVIGYCMFCHSLDVNTVVYAYTDAMIFASVGLPGSGADIELTSLDVVDGINIRLSSISLNF